MFLKSSVNIYYFHIVCQSSSSSEYLFIFFSSVVFLNKFIVIQLQLINVVIAYQVDFPLF